MEIFLTFRNADMTEGRGPDVPDKAFLHLKDAAGYIDDKPGVMGRRQKWSEIPHGDWNIRSLLVHEGPFDPQAEARKQALAKLTMEERVLLGLVEG